MLGLKKISSIDIIESKSERDNLREKKTDIKRDRRTLTDSDRQTYRDQKTNRNNQRKTDIEADYDRQIIERLRT